ncbi:TonB-dependent receptor [Novosphingobium sp. BL-52-GroH]|uniref:TonB-dependent receptor n=1 Tax=Novosphingobium sp. BL-52-GroH TaxID=3349877 RepID=UPI00384E44EC
MAQEIASDTGDGLGEIVVTAEKRESTVQRTPISVAVIDSASVARNGIGTLSDAIKVLPSVQFGRNFANSIVTIRGVSSRDTDETGDPAVAISLDGIYFQRSLGINDAVFDLERIEALKGPQGTLYGRSATGGAINFVSAKPGKDFDAYVGGTVGNYGAIVTEGMLNVPVSDTIQVRAAFQTRYHDGYRNNAPARNGDDQDSKAARIHVAFQPTDKLSGLLTAEIVRSNGVGAANYGSPLVFDSSGNVIHDKPVLPSGGKTWALGYPSGYTDTETTAFRWNLKYDFGAAELSYLGGYRKLKFRALIDLDGMEDHAGLYGTNTYFAPQSEKPTTTSHELRLSGKPGTALDWQVGVLYFKEKNDVYTELSYFDTSNDPDVAFIFSYPDLGTESKAVFGQATYHFTDQLSVEGGVRYTHDEKWRNGYADYSAFDLYIPIAQKGKWNKTTWHAGINYQASPDNMIYAKYDTGYKPGGYTDVAPYGPENITAYEIGSKNRFLDDKLQLNLAAFYYDYTDQQVLQFVGSQTIIQNAGKSEYYGAEAEVQWLVAPNTRIEADVSYLHARYKEFEIAGATANLDLAGNTPPQAPDWSGNFAIEHGFYLANGGTITARAQTHLQSTTHLQFYNYASDRQAGYSRSDFTLTYQPDDKKWLVEAFVRNIEDKVVLTAAQEQSLVQAYVYQFADPRTYGVRFRMNF